MEWNPVNLYRQGRQFWREVVAEFRKVTWPSRKEYTGGTIGVLAVVAVITLVLGLVDFGLSHVVQWVLP